MRAMIPAALLSLLAALPAVAADPPAGHERTVRYVQQLQQPDGGFLPYADAQESSLRATSAALRALKYFGGEAREPKAAAAFVQRCYVPESGAFAEIPGGKADVFTTAVGLMAAKELNLPLERYRDKSVAYLTENARTFEDVRIAVAGLEALGDPARLLSKAQAKKWKGMLPEIRQADGSFKKDARLLGSVVAALYRLGYELEGPEAVKACAEAMRAGRNRADGAFGEEGAKTSDLGSTYRVLRSFVRLDQPPGEEERLREFVAACRNPDGGYGNQVGEKSSVPATYYAGIILHWLDGMKGR